ncbi:MAG: ATP-binding protein [Ruthenibacterium sp.]
MTQILSPLLLICYGCGVMYLLLDIHKRDISRRQCVLFLLSCALLLCGNAWLLFFLDAVLYGKYYFFFVQLPSFFLFSIITRYRGTRLLFVLLTAITMSAPVVQIPILVRRLYGLDTFSTFAIRAVICAAMFFILTQWFCPAFHYMLGHQKTGWLSFCAVPAFYYCLTHLLGHYNYTGALYAETGALRMLLMLLVFSVYGLFLQLFQRTRQQMSLQNEQNMLEQQLSATQNYLEQLEDSQAKTAIYRHDLRHHLQYVSACIKSDRLPEAQSYIASVCDGIAAASMTRYCQNDTVNLILSAYAAKAKKYGIPLSITTEVPESIHVFATDVSMIFANGLENALNASRCLPAGETPTILISCTSKKGKLFLQIQNHYQGVVKFQGDVPCAEKAGHGNGIKSMIAVVEKYGGVYSFTAEQGVFTLHVIL